MQEKTYKRETRRQELEEHPQGRRTRGSRSGGKETNEVKEE